MEGRRPRPLRPELPPLPPFDGDDGDDWDLPGSARERLGDGGMLRIAGVILILGLLIALLLLPPISILDRGAAESTSFGGITIRARGSMPDLPDGLQAASALYNIEAPRSLSGPVTLTVRLDKPVEPSVRSLAFYTHTDGRWKRLASVAPVDSGGAVRGEVPAVPTNIAVLRRIAYARPLALIVGPGETPDPAAGDARIVCVLGAVPGGAEDGVQLSERLGTGLNGRYLG